jgi:hypothetical protein
MLPRKRRLLPLSVLGEPTRARLDLLVPAASAPPPVRSLAGLLHAAVPLPAPQAGGAAVAAAVLHRI